MIMFLSALIMFHALLFLLLSMPKYNKQVSHFPKRDKKLESSFRFVGNTLVATSIALLIIVNGFGVGIAWTCGLLTLLGSIVSVMFALNPMRTSGCLVWLPKKLSVEISSKAAYLYLLVYSILTFNFVMLF